jgi:DNA-binding transcriptional ArsR family regulator
MRREEAMRLALRCARDSIPPARLEILVDVARHPSATPADVSKRIGKPWTTVKRELDALMMLGMVESWTPPGEDARPGARLRASFDRKTLLAMAGRSSPDL